MTWPGWGWWKAAGFRYVLNIKSKEFSDGLDEGCERKRDVEVNSGLGLGRWECGAAAL